MTSKTRNKLNHLLTNLPPSKVLTSSWLKKQGVAERLAWWYVHAGWLKRIGENAYQVAGQEPSYLDAVSALQEQLNIAVHVGGKTAIQLMNASHFVPIRGPPQALLFSNQLKILPHWITHSDRWKIKFKLCRAKLFSEKIDQATLFQDSFNNVPVKLSCPERAMMEVLEQVPQKEELEEALLLMENLVQLRPSVVQLLLENCTSVKVKRLFLYLAKRVGHRWLNSLNLSAVDLGKGKRKIGQGGHYNAEYQLSVPFLSRDDDEQLPAV